MFASFPESVAELENVRKASCSAPNVATSIAPVCSSSKTKRKEFGRSKSLASLRQLALFARSIRWLLSLTCLEKPVTEAEKAGHRPSRSGSDKACNLLQLQALY